MSNQLESLKIFESIPGDVSYYYENLITGETRAFNEDLPLVAASVIKIPIMAEAFRQFESGECDPDMLVTIRPEDKYPSCGVLTYMHDGITVPVRDLVTLMIIVSDNTATNLLMNILGIDKVNALLDSCGIHNTRLRRRLFDSALSQKGITNHITARDIGHLLKLMYEGKLVSPESSKKMISILLDQRLNGKLPFKLCKAVKIAHKTGEDDNTTHDVGIVFAKEPFVLCVCSNHVNVPVTERAMQDVCYELCRPTLEA